LLAPFWYRPAQRVRLRGLIDALLA
jgi:hypothetical protein